MVNSKDIAGQAKAPLRWIPVQPLEEVARVILSGHKHDVPPNVGFNWRHEPITAAGHAEAILRHTLAYIAGEDLDESGYRHLAHITATGLIILDAEYAGMLIDDRFPQLKEQ